MGITDTLKVRLDALVRADSYCEGVVRKTERQVSVTWYASKKGEDRSPYKFNVRNTDVFDYIKRWSWDRWVYPSDVWMLANH